MPIAAPPIAAAIIGPALSLQENALLPALPWRSLALLCVALERLDDWLWVRVAMNSSLPGIRTSTDRREAPFRSQTLSYERFDAWLDAVIRRLRPITRRGCRRRRLI